MMFPGDLPLSDASIRAMLFGTQVPGSGKHRRGCQVSHRKWAQKRSSGR